MTRKGKKLEPKLYLDMDFSEALERFGTTNPNEVKELIERAKRKKNAGKTNDLSGSKVDRKGKSG